MAKVDLGPVAPRALPSVRGAFYIRDTRWGPRAQAWPKPRKNWSLLQKQYRTRFAFAARMAATPYPLDYQTAVEMAKGTEQVPRDILTMAALGQYYEIVGPDGIPWGHVEGPIAQP